MLNVTRSELNSLQTEQYLNAIQVLCTGKGHLTASEFNSLVETMKGENLPQQWHVTGNVYFCIIWKICN